MEDSTAIIEQGCLCNSSIFCQKGFQETEGVDTLSFSGEYKTGQNTMHLKSALRPCAKTDFPEDHQTAQSLLRMIIRGGDVSMAEESKEVFLFRTSQEFPEHLGRPER